MDVERSNGAVKLAFDIQVNGKHGPGRLKYHRQKIKRLPRWSYVWIFLMFNRD